MEKTEGKLDLERLRDELAECASFLNQAADCIAEMWLMLDGRTDETVRHRELIISKNGHVHFEEE